MKIAFLVNEFPKLSETFIVNKILAVKEAGHEVLILSAEHPFETEKLRDLQWAVIEKQLLNSTVYIKTFLHQVLNDKKNLGNYEVIGDENYGIQISPICLQDVDVVHAFFGPNGMLALKLKYLGYLNSPILTSFHGFDLSRFVQKHGREVYSKLFSKGDYFLPVSNHLASKLRELGCPDNKIMVNRSAISLRNLDEKRERGVAQNPVKFVSVGRLVEKKGIEIALRALHLLRPKFSFEYCIVGEGPLAPSLKDLVFNLGLAKQVHFEGKVAPHFVEKILMKNDIFLGPYMNGLDGDEEGIPNALKEAIALGLWYVASDIEGVKELVLSEKYLAPQGNPEAFADKILEVVQQAKFSSFMGPEKNFVISEFSIEKISTQLIDIYRQCSSQSAK